MRQRRNGKRATRPVLGGRGGGRAKEEEQECRREERIEEGRAGLGVKCERDEDLVVADRRRDNAKMGD